MSEFDEALAQAVEDGIARGGLPGAADAVRRGRKRSLRARGGVAVLGVAAVGGAFGVTASLGGITGGADTAAAAVTTAATTPTTAGHSASVPTPVTESAPGSAHGDGLLAAKLWPGYDLVRWNPRPSNPSGVTKSVGSLVLHCYPSTVNPPMPKTFPITGFSMWGNEYNTAHHLDADETVFTFADEAGASAFLADTRQAGSAPGCDSGPGASVPSQGVSTDRGVSWLITQQVSPVDKLPSVDHDWLVQSGNRVALLRVEQFGSDFRSTADDAKVLAQMQQALEK
jgi:hypothetical protein